MNFPFLREMSRLSLMFKYVLCIENITTSRHFSQAAGQVADLPEDLGSKVVFFLQKRCLQQGSFCFLLGFAVFLI